MRPVVGNPEKWIAKPAEWPALLQGLTPLRPVSPWPPTPDIYLMEDPGLLNAAAKTESGISCFK